MTASAPNASTTVGHGAVRPEPLYVCGHSPRELERLAVQGAFYEDITRRVFEAAGIASGMRVLDIGCGAGDVSFLAADLVGHSGRVVGVDRSPQAIAVARARAASRGLSHVEFRESRVENLSLGWSADAVVGRFVLMHQADPATALRHAAGHVRAGGIVAVLESHMAASLPGVHSSPHSPTYDRVTSWMTEIIRAAGAHADMGLRLRDSFLQAGLPEPTVWLEARVEGGPDAAIISYIAESARSMLPLAERLGVTTPLPIALDQLETHLREELTASGGVLTSPLVVGAYCRVGGTTAIDAEDTADDEGAENGGR